MTKITLKVGEREYSVEVPSNDLSLISMIDELITPLMLAAGYHPNTVKEYFEQ